MAFARQAETDVPIDRGFQSQTLAGVTEAGCFPCVLGIHPEINDVCDNLGVPLGLHVSSHDSEREERLSVLEDHRGHKRVEGTFPWRQTVPVRRIERIRSASVVQHDTRTTDYNAGSKR